ncbi:MAG: hypothetical protein IPK39_05700 [Sulfuritalea sp.]|nr:hypothetical protein [Sulfuritalea sp.]
MTTGAKADWGVALLSSTGLLLTAWALARSGNAPVGVSPEIAGWAYFSLILIALIPMEVALILGRLPGNYADGLHLQSYIYTTYGVAATGFVLLAIAIQQRSLLVGRYLPLGLAIGQVGASFLIFDAYPARLLSPDGVISEYRVSAALPIILAAIALWAVFDVLMRFRRFRRTDTPKLSMLLSPTALFFLVAFAKAGYTVPPHISPDDYHLGEHLVGWWSYLKGMVPMWTSYRRTA